MTKHRNVKLSEFRLTSYIWLCADAFFHITWAKHKRIYVHFICLYLHHSHIQCLLISFLFTSSTCMTGGHTAKCSFSVKSRCRIQFQYPHPVFIELLIWYCESIPLPHMRELYLEMNMKPFMFQACLLIPRNSFLSSWEIIF